MVKTENTLKVENEELAKSSALIPLNMENKEFEMLMSLYENAKNDIVQKLTIIQEYLKEVYEYDVVNHITSRIKTKESYIPIKVEIQLRTMAMDFWATTEHKIKYKKKHELSSKDSKKMKIYSKILNIIDDNIMKIYEIESKI